MCQKLLVSSCKKKGVSASHTERACMRQSGNSSLQSTDRQAHNMSTGMHIPCHLHTFMQISSQQRKESSACTCIQPHSAVFNQHFNPYTWITNGLKLTAATGLKHLQRLCAWPASILTCSPGLLFLRIIPGCCWFTCMLIASSPSSRLNLAIIV